MTDLSAPDRAAPLDFARTDTEATADPVGPSGSLAVNGPFGYGWTFCCNLKAVAPRLTPWVTSFGTDNWYSEEQGETRQQAVASPGSHAGTVASIPASRGRRHS